MPESAIECLLRQLDTSLTAYFEAANQVGQYQETSNELAASSPSGLVASLLSFQLGPGDWDVEANLIWDLTAATVTQMEAGLSAVNNTLPTDNSVSYIGTQYVTTTAKDSMALPRKRFNLAVTTTIYLVTKSIYSTGAGSVQMLGLMTARRATL